jgi:Holliday junction resolvase RusA-like endonuclease
MADWDNPIKPLQDILQKKYGFDDRRIMKASVIKNVVKKGDGYLNFSIRGIE